MANKLISTMKMPDGTAYDIDAVYLGGYEADEFAKVEDLDNKADVYGSVINLVNAAFDGSGAKIDVKYSGVDGDWLDFIRTRHSNSKSLGMIITSLYNNIKFNGKSCQIDTASITYVSNNKMALVSTGNSRVYTLGYTDEEIATNTATGGVWAGKTVIKCD
jgi:hypothetical protein